MLTALLDHLPRLPAFRVLLAEPDSTSHGLLQAAHPFVTAGLYHHRPGPLILLTARSETAQEIAAQLAQWLPPPVENGQETAARILVFAEPDSLPYERIRWSSATRQQRLTALAALQSRTQIPPIVVASARALAQKTLPARELRLALRPIAVGDFVRLEQMAQTWAQTGYNPVDVVEEPGAFARRGGIVDIWPPNLPNPVRIDLFGDEVESLRIFDPATQRTLRRVDSVQIGPGSEVLSKFGPAALERLGVRGGSLTDPSNLDAAGAEESPLLDPRLLLAVREELRLEVDHLSQGHSFHGIEWYLPYFYAQPATLVDYLPPASTLVIDDAAELVATLHDLEEQAAALHGELVRSGDLPHAFLPSFVPAAELTERITAGQPIILGYGTLAGADTSSHSDLARSFVPGPRYGGKIKQIAGDVAKERRDGAALVLVTRQAARLQDTLQEAGVIAHVQSELGRAPAPGSVSLVQGVIGEGFVMRGLEDEAAGFDLHFLTDTELFGWSKPRARRRSPRHSTVAPELFFADVKPGDHVVHLEHGVGIYDGLVTLELGGLTREYLQVSYARGDKLYVPVHQAERLSRYVGAGEATPAVNRLGTADWQLVKERARRAVADIADDLLKLYAERELVSGHSFSPDGPWHQELAASFAYEETDDQLDAIDEVTRDMESERPMDRLICGDVGYGKTEVAVRAAFKAIVDGKQVAMLVPTTVLAQQHFRTLSNRLNRFPVRVEMLSRFRTPAQQEQIIQGLAEGRIDMVVGTHRLLSRDLDFKNLGLLIIDEEQRFGVVQKEKLKQLRTQIDVLTLSATPIPRTLHMSLSGVRDMSAITTPPRERLPVHTVLSEYDDNLVRQAIERELARNGQVFVVHHRVRNIEHLADRIRHLVPQARVVVGHGQMPERALENVMLQFAEGEYDVLVATTIIENGLDIPNANTMIINRADRFGLAQLYQLRGRVGRSAQRGHCYLLYDKHAALSYDARRRLSAIIESSEELGAGFRIAMRDLEIRGAGDLLGARQHGHIDSVGFDLYTRLLAQAINEAKRRKHLFDQALRKQDGDQADGAQEVQETQDTPAPEIAPVTLDGTEQLTDLEGPFDLADPLAPPVLLDLPIEAKIPESYIAEETIRLQMYRRIAGMTHLKSIDEMRKELIDRFGAVDDENAAPEEVENLFFLIRVKILALKAGVQNIGRELDQLVIRSEALENMNRPAMQHRLRQAFGAPGEDLPEDAFPRVARRAIYLPLDDAEAWRTALVRTLEIMAYG
ncbi:MAG: transcription-repair coupling factor [Chloroflexota bacterium]|nr:transcription-repair coupling factor [Chloroflexota bacterium]